MTKQPVLFFCYNRPDKTLSSLAPILEYKPSKLYVVCDGPKSAADDVNVERVRALINSIPKVIEVISLFREANLGCRPSISTGISWFFEHEEQGIILEDDCCASPQFFLLCDYLLNKYRYDERIGMISGSNFQDGEKRGSASYYFSYYGHIWGWATWKRAWNSFTYSIDRQQLRSRLSSYFRHRPTTAYYLYILSLLEKGSISTTWDYYWNFSLWKHGYINIIANVNLIKNIGFDETATHTTSQLCSHQDILPVSLDMTNKIKIVDTTEVCVDSSADSYLTAKRFKSKSLRAKCYFYVRSLFIP